ncbi:MAG TPA: hypothetical protein VFY10_12480 [Dehalococcoidia bacterium]|nr:hypothetical protein [Dehalococcoidia bacterium]
MTKLGWTVLLLGGGSATGKTTLGEALARRYDARYIDLDLFWITLQRAIPSDVEPALHLFEDDAVWEEAPALLVERYLRAAAYVSWASERLIAHHCRIETPVVIEGSWLLPSFAVQHAYDGHEVGSRVRSLFLFEPSSREIESRIRSRRVWLDRLHAHSQRNHIDMQALYGLEIKHRAEALALPVLESRPFETLEARALAALSMMV